MVIDGLGNSGRSGLMFCLTFIYISEVLNVAIDGSGNSGQSGPEVLPDLHLDLRGANTS